MSRANNLDSEFYMHQFDSPSYGRQTTRKPFDAPKDVEERKEAVIIVVLILSILIFFVIKLIIDHYKRSKNSTNYNRTIRTEVVRAESSQIQLPCRRVVHHARDDAREMNRLNSIHSYGSGEAQFHRHDPGRASGFSRQLGSQNRGPWCRENVRQNQVLFDVLGTDVCQDRRHGRNQSYRTSSPSVRLHIRDDDLLVDQRSNRSVSCQDLPPSYEMITECSILDSSSVLDRADSGPAVLDLAALPSYTDVIRSQIRLSGYSDDIEMFSNEGQRENESCRS